jgi:hypothetical protein
MRGEAEHGAASPRPGLDVQERDLGMEDVSKFVVGGLAAVLGLVGLILASGALDDEMYLFGLALAAFAVFFNLLLVKQHFDRQDAAHAVARHPVQGGGAGHE